MSVTKDLMDPIDFQCSFFPTVEVNGVHQLFGYPYSSKYLLLCSAEQTTSGGVSNDIILMFG